MWQTFLLYPSQTQSSLQLLPVLAFLSPLLYCSAFQQSSFQSNRGLPSFLSPCLILFLPPIISSPPTSLSLPFLLSLQRRLRLSYLLCKQAAAIASVRPARQLSINGEKGCEEGRESGYQYCGYQADIDKKYM